MGVLVLNGLVGLHRITQLQFFSITGQGIDLDYHDIEWFALEMNRDHSIALRLHPNAAFWTFFLLTMMVTPLLLRDSCPQ